MPCVSGSIVPYVVNRFHGDGIGSSHFSNRCVDQSAADSLAAELLAHVYGIDNSNPPWLDDGGNGFPIIDAPDQKTGHDPVRFGHESNAIGLPEPASQPLFHCGVGIRPDLHIGTCNTLEMLQPCLLDLRQIVTTPFTYGDFHADFEIN